MFIYCHTLCLCCDSLVLVLSRNCVCVLPPRLIVSLRETRKMYKKRWNTMIKGLLSSTRQLGLSLLCRQLTVELLRYYTILYNLLLQAVGPPATVCFSFSLCYRTIGMGQVYCSAYKSIAENEFKNCQRMQARLHRVSTTDSDQI